MKKNILEVMIFYIFAFFILFFSLKDLSVKQSIVKKEVPKINTYLGKNNAIINGGYSGFYLFDLKNNKIKSKVNTGSYVNDIKVIGNILYLTDKQGLKLYNIQKMQLLNEYNTFGDALSLFVEKNEIYVGDGKNGIVVFELKPGGFLRLKKHITIKGIVTSMAKYKQYLFVVGPKIGIKIFDDNFKEVYSFSKLFSPIQILIDKDKLYLLDKFLGFYTFNVNSFFEHKPEFKAVSYTIYSFAVDDDVVYLATSDGIYTLKEKMYKIISGDFTNTKIKIFDSYMYLNMYDRGLKVYDLPTLKLIKEYNKMDSVSMIKPIKNGFIVTDDKKIYETDLNFNILNTKKLPKKIIKTTKNLYAVQNNKVENIITKTTFFATANNVFEADKCYYTNKSGTFELSSNKKIVGKQLTDILVIKNNKYYVFENKVFLNNSMIFETTKQIIKSYFDKYVYLFTEKGLYKLNEKFEKLDFYSTETTPYRVVFSDNYIFFSIQNKLVVLNKNLKKIKEIAFNLPISDIAYNKNLYVSLLYEGIFIYDKDLKVVKKIDTFNAINLEVF